MKLLQGYRTMIVNFIVALIGVIAVMFPEAQLPTPEELGMTVDQFIGALLALLAVINMILRAVTKTPMFRKEE